MNLMRNRPLACCSMTLLLALTVAAHTSSLAKLCLGGAALLFLLVFVLLCKRLRRKAPPLAPICVLLSLTALLYGHLRFDRYFDLADEHPGEVTVIGRVQEITYESEHALSLTVECETIDGVVQDGRLSVWAYTDKSPAVGERISFTATLLPLSKEDSLSLHLRAKGIAAKAEDVFEITVISTDKRPTDMLRIGFSTLRQSLGTHLSNHVPGDGGALMRALLLGEQELLPDTVRRDFRRTGLSHVLSLSGLHVSLLVGVLASLCRRLRVPRIASILSQILLVLFYMALTGFSLSITRAGMMTLFVSLSFFARREADGITSLSFAAALIALFSPNAVYDCGYWLSVTATLGILVYNELRKKEIAPVAWYMRLLHGVRASLAVTLSATLATLPLVAFFFGEFSLLTPLSNLLLIPFFNLYLLLATIALPFGMLLPISAFSSVFGDFLLSCIAYLAKWRGICIPIDYLPFQLLLIVFAAALLFLLFFTRIGKRRMTLLGISALTLLCLCLGGIGIRQLTLNGVYYAYAGTNEAMLIQSGKNAILCDLSNGSYTAQKGGLRTVEEAHLTELEGYLLSHYHERHIKSLPRLCGQILIRTLYLPIPQSEEEEAIYRALTAAASKMGMDCALYDPYKDIALGSMTLHPHENGASDSAHPALAISVRHGKELLTYLGSGYHESDRSSTAGSAVKKSTVLIFGLHGPKEDGPPNYPHYHESLSAVILPRKDRLSPALTDFLGTRCRLVNQNAVVFIAL